MSEISIEEFEKDMKEMEIRMKVLRAEYNQYLTGVLKAPPNFTVAFLRKQIRKYALIRGLKGVQRFQYFNLVAKFNTMMEFYNRRIRDKQEGKQLTYGFVRTDPNTENNSQDSPDPEKRIEYVPDKGHIISNARKQNATMRHMYEKWVDFSKQTRGSAPKIGFDKFQSMINSKTQQIKTNKDCRAVKFKIVLVDGTVKINAKTIK